MAPSDKKSIIIRSQRTDRLSYHEQGTKGSTYRCQACLERGCGPYYSRNSNGHKLYYHEFCGRLLSSESSSAASVRKHPLHPTVNLVLQVTKPHNVRPCVVCGDEVRMLRYGWWHKKEQGSRNIYGAFHPLCASLPAQIGGSHEYGIVLRLEEKIRGKCVLCKGDSTNSKGWAYNNITGRCWHVRCTKEKTRGGLPKKEEKEALRKKKEKEALRKKKASPENKVTIYGKKASPPVLITAAKVALQLIAVALFGTPHFANLLIDFIRLLGL